jgi:lipoprotein-anchoring transpeptidase ErfK/SrfK
LEGLDIETITSEIRVDLSDRSLTLMEDGEVILETAIAVGTADAPTPTGRFSVTDKLQSPEPDGAYGPFALGLSARSEVVTEFAGGDGQIGIHGTDDPASIGQPESHGCLRVPNDVITELNRRLPIGTPVVVQL